ncbi:Similar to Tia1: Nucleolysin TIA-1 (Mus musculus) [Cotesia congregata]|uniref:Similar to Tia1: Nucleolysin TIA-1 (Mus musculus) n=1 Tax=Cotesia congregata TaxID=51543 RepID=A0A8J2HPV3_COTCN|nr:Similar to Tia1: Nucleolysin TIA-1 (Mus musculus) [Cotesia congregata]
MSEESNPRTLYVGNLDPSVSEDLLCTLFSQIGPIKGCKIIREPGNDPYAFVEFTNHQCAATALAAMNKRLFLDKEMKVNWATSPGNQPKLDTSNHHHIFVGDLSPEIETQTLKEAFAPFGEISNCRIVRDPQTLKSKGYAFVSFVKKSEAEAAITAMNGQWLGSRSIRTNWSTRKPPPPRSERPRHTNNSKPNYEEVYAQSSPTNCTVYCGGFTNGITEDLINKTFSPFGTINDIRVFKDKGYAFIKFTTKEAATHAIEATHNTEINGSVVKCFWGKENGDPNSVGPNANQQAQQVTAGAGQYPYGYGQQMSYWYPQGYPQMQGQFLQPAQYYSQYYSQQQAQQYMNSMRMPAPAAGTWQPGQATAAPPSGTAGLQPGQQTVVYTMPQYPTQ